MEACDVVVVGAGPAGASAAGVLGAAGRRVLLLDKAHFPRDKVCGDGITAKCMGPLARLGVLDAFRRTERFEARGFALSFSDGTELTVRRRANGEGAPVSVLRRWDFDRLLLDGALRHPGVRLLGGTKVRSLVVEDGRIAGVVAEREGGRQAFRAPLVIDASGATSHVAVEAGAGNQDPHRCALAIRGYYRNVAGLGDAIELYLSRAVLPGYFWIFPVSDTVANVGIGTFQHIVERRRLDLRRLLPAFVAEHPGLRARLRDAEPCGTLSGGRIPLGLDVQASRVRDGLLLVGDAASFTDPLTAEGISYALRSGIMAAETAVAALDAGDCSARALAGYDARWRAEFGERFARGAALGAPLPDTALAAYLGGAFAARSAPAPADAAGDRYETLLKLKVLRKVV